MSNGRSIGRIKGPLIHRNSVSLQPVNRGYLMIQNSQAENRAASRILIGLN